MNWKGKKVLILGLGQYPKGSGISSAIFLAKQGAILRVTDQKKENDLKANVTRLRRFKNIKIILGKHRDEDIRWADVIVRNPRVRPSSKEMLLASKLGKKIESDITLFLEKCPCTVIGVTGTRGKSTTSTLISEMLKASGKRVWLGGNILVSPLTFLKNVKPSDIVVLELSSWQLETTGSAGISPHVAVVTNLMRDHLNSYEGMEDYAEAKAQIFRHQKPNDVLIVNGDDPYCRVFAGQAPGKVLRFSKRKSPIKKSDVKIPGEHNFLNASAAALAAMSSGASKASIKKTLKSFNGLPHRQEIVAIKNKVIYVNDTTATTPDGAIAAIKTFYKKEQTIHMIVGGADKELEFDVLAREMKRYRVDVAVLPGTAYAKLSESLEDAKVKYRNVSSLKEAVDNLVGRSKSGDVIILSPACASFGLFKNEFDRGEQFKNLVNKLKSGVLPR